MKRLRDTMRDDLALRGMSANTIGIYVRCARRFAEHFGRSPCRMGAPEIRAFLLHLARERGRSASTVNVYAAALAVTWVPEPAGHSDGGDANGQRGPSWQHDCGGA